MWIVGFRVGKGIPGEEGVVGSSDEGEKELEGWEEEGRKLGGVEGLDEGKEEGMKLGALLNVVG